MNSSRAEPLFYPFRLPFGLRIGMAACAVHKTLTAEGFSYEESYRCFMKKVDKKVTLVPKVLEGATIVIGLDRVLTNPLDLLHITLIPDYKQYDFHTFESARELFLAEEAVLDYFETLNTRLIKVRDVDDEICSDDDYINYPHQHKAWLGPTFYTAVATDGSRFMQAEFDDSNAKVPFLISLFYSKTKELALKQPGYRLNSWMLSPFVGASGCRLSEAQNPQIVRTIRRIQYEERSRARRMRTAQKERQHEDMRHALGTYKGMFNFDTERFGTPNIAIDSLTSYAQFQAKIEQYYRSRTAYHLTYDELRAAKQRKKQVQDITSLDELLDALAWGYFAQTRDLYYNEALFIDLTSTEGDNSDDDEEIYGLNLDPLYDFLCTNFDFSVSELEKMSFTELANLFSALFGDEDDDDDEIDANDPSTDHFVDDETLYGAPPNATDPSNQIRPYPTNDDDDDDDYYDDTWPDDSEEW